MAQLRKGGQTLPAHLACLRGNSWGGAGQTAVPLHLDLCAAGRGHRGTWAQGAKGGCIKRGDATCGPSDLPSGKGPPFAHKRGRGSKGWCGGLHSESLGARVKGVVWRSALRVIGGKGQRGGVEVHTPSHWGQGSKGETAYLSRIALAPLLGCQGRVAQIPHVEDGEMPAHVSSRRHTRHTPACFATPVVHDRLHGNGHVTGAVLPSIQPSCPPPSYPKRPCSCTHSTHGEWGRGRGKHRANGRGLRADTVSAPPPHRTSPFTCKGIGGMNSTCGREECPLSPRSIHDTERGGHENGPVRVRGRGEGRVQGMYQSRRHVFLAVLATRSCDVREGTARPGFCG